MRRPGKIVCVGRNYVEHAKELGNEVPKEPLLFLKPPSSVVFDGEPIVLPDMSRRVEHEGEIGVIIGTRLRQGDDAAARAAVAGITCVNDVTARDLQKSDGQWTRAKGFDTFCPMGPGLMPVDAGFNFSGLEVVCRVNGVERQRGRAADMVFGIPTLLAFISRVMTLEPGDLVATGTPAGIGPLVDGDLVEVEIPGVGVLRNPVRSR
ncbi:MAG: fumarylacetoacetate hydrolase family protein [Gemmatimonadales bacterium]|jgi:2-keto-4-pentenoate hydratase/2-oxohepta-3-ene-1,7-dioic acid hydratase in catechol pathway